MNYYKRHLGDYAKKAGHLTPLEHGVYNLIMDAYYDREQPPTKAEAYRWARARCDDEKAAVDAVLAEFFTEHDGKYTQSRIEDEIRQAAENAAKNAENGKKGGRPRKANKSDQKPDGLIPLTQTKGNPLIHKSTNPVIPPKSPKGDWPGFADFWSAYPRKTDKAKALKAWNKIKPDDSLVNVILNAVRTQSMTDQWQRDNGQYIPHPTTWLNGERWADQLDNKPKTQEPPQQTGGMKIHRAGNQ